LPKIIATKGATFPALVVVTIGADEYENSTWLKTVINLTLVI
jgi:hypothetical protein